jgi:hypothetical protein
MSPADSVCSSLITNPPHRLVFVFIMPIALANIGWKMYFINGSWDLVIIVIMAMWWIETKGKTLEEIDEAIEGRRYSHTANSIEGAGNVVRDSNIKSTPSIHPDRLT